MVRICMLSAMVVSLMGCDGDVGSTAQAASSTSAPRALDTRVTEAAVERLRTELAANPVLAEKGRAYLKTRGVLALPELAGKTSRP